MELNVVEAKVLTEGLRWDWEAFRSQFAEAVDNRVWEQLGYTRMTEWLLDTFGEMRLPGVGELARVATPEAGAAARVSRPGSRRSTTPTAREASGRSSEVQTFFKPARR